MKEYNTTIDFYWSPYLVESNADDLWSHHNITNRIVRIQAIENHAKHWTDADAIVFGTYLWWRYPTIHVLWGSFNRSDGIYKDVEMLRCYEMALQTWSDWLEIQINRSKTQLSADWGMPADQKCYNEKEPIYREEYQGRETLTHANMMRAVEAAIEKLKKRGLNVQMLNITRLSDYRKDGHPSIYRKFWHSLSQDQLSYPPSYADCGHWCLPGVPDAWNEILYAYMAP
ncbi:PC-Esterase [Dillenia turbinata]|uniref:PC-Esterase n=1 Tax=Dillenia turbinata TaxID=194707 RepID=A0AAN8VZG1_9MAGN